MTKMRENVPVTDAVEATPSPAVPHTIEVCAVCSAPLGQQRWRALDQIVCSTGCAKVVHGDK